MSFGERQAAIELYCTDVVSKADSRGDLSLGAVGRIDN